MSNSKSKKERIVWILLVAALITVFAVIFAKGQVKSADIEQKIVQLETEKNELKAIEEEMCKKVTMLENELENNLKIINGFSVNNPNILISLKRQGFNGSIQDIIDDLVRHDELIPHKGVLGGKMGFYHKDNIYVLSDRRVFAYFEDGHISGYAMLGYKIKDDVITWEVIDSYIVD
ncbi:MAG: hypothetical protein GX154_06260 [Clostridiales bacterium]|nr:hypothetical protein [Clostridiales bacterium]